VPFYKKSTRGFSDVHLYTTSFILEESLQGKWLITHDDPCQSIETLVLLMLRLYFQGAEQNKTMIEQLFTTVEQLLFHHLQEEYPQQHLIEHMAEMIKGGYTNPEFSLSQIFEGQNYCPNHLRRLFKQKMGMSVSQYKLNSVDYSYSPDVNSKL
jgi:AraC-like DNA-binding protein